MNYMNINAINAFNTEIQNGMKKQNKSSINIQNSLKKNLLIKNSNNWMFGTDINVGFSGVSNEMLKYGNTTEWIME